MAMGDIERDGPTHRVADHDDLLGAEHSCNGHGVIGCIFERELVKCAQSSTVPPMVDCNE
jgi:hypothetical protein